MCAGRLAPHDKGLKALQLLSVGPVCSRASYDHLVVTGEISIQPGATLTLNFENGFAPTQGETLTSSIMEVSTRSTSALPT
jgi:hypothetical protein